MDEQTLSFREREKFIKSRENERFRDKEKAPVRQKKDHRDRQRN
jgi:hypothetical protein